MYESQYVIEDVTNPDDIARFRAQDVRHRRNSAWLQTHWAEVFPQTRGKFLKAHPRVSDHSHRAQAWQKM